MARNEHLIAASPEEVWHALADGRLYTYLVVGTKRIRKVDPGWPEPGTRIHYSIGIGPLRREGVTEVVEADPPKRLLLRIDFGMLGKTDTVFTLEPDGARTCIAAEEYGSRGALGAIWNPVFDWLMWLRNRELVRRLEEVSRRPTAPVED